MGYGWWLHHHKVMILYQIVTLNLTFSHTCSCNSDATLKPPSNQSHHPICITPCKQKKELSLLSRRLCPALCISLEGSTKLTLSIDFGHTALIALHSCSHIKLMQTGTLSNRYQLGYTHQSAELGPAPKSNTLVGAKSGNLRRTCKIHGLVPANDFNSLRTKTTVSRAGVSWTSRSTRWHTA